MNRAEVDNVKVRKCVFYELGVELALSVCPCVRYSLFPAFQPKLVVQF